MNTKQCFKCLTIKPLTEFYKHPEMLDGRVNKCKECNKADVKKNRADKIDYYIEYDRGRANLPKRVIARYAYSKSEPGKVAAIKANSLWKENNQIKRCASIIVRNAVRDGRLIKQNCCGVCSRSGGVIHGHHDDYAYPMTVRWLCPKCHCDWHKLNGSGLNG